MHVLTVVGAIALFVASCGGSTFPSVNGSPSSTTTAVMTKAEYLVRANAICRTMDARIAAIGDPGNDLSKEVQAYDAGAAIAADILRQLRRLPAPDGEAASLARIYAEMDKTLEDAARLSAALRAGDEVTARQAALDARSDSLAGIAQLNAYGLTDCGSSSPENNPAVTTTTTLPKPACPTLEVKPGVNSYDDDGPGKPLFEIRGTGSHTTPPLDFSITCLSGGVSNSGGVKVSIAPAGQTSGDSGTQYYADDIAGDGGASALLPLPGKYVVMVEAAYPNVRWTVDIKGLSDGCSPTLEVTQRIDSVVHQPYFEIRGTGSRTSPPLDFPMPCVTGQVSNSGGVKVSIAPAAQTSGDAPTQFYANEGGNGVTGAKLPRPGKYVVIVEAAQSNVHWTIDIADRSAPYTC